MYTNYGIVYLPILYSVNIFRFLLSMYCIDAVNINITMLTIYWNFVDNQDVQFRDTEGDADIARDSLITLGYDSKYHISISCTCMVNRNIAYTGLSMYVYKRWWSRWTCGLENFCPISSLVPTIYLILRFYIHSHIGLLGLYWGRISVL